MCMPENQDLTKQLLYRRCMHHPKHGNVRSCLQVVNESSTYLRSDHEAINMISAGVKTFSRFSELL
jgi:hypothetical protein